MTSPSIRPEKIEELIAEVDACDPRDAPTCARELLDRVSSALESLRTDRDGAVQAIREISACIFDDNGDVTWSPMDIKRIARAFLTAQDKS